MSLQPFKPNPPIKPQPRTGKRPAGGHLIGRKVRGCRNLGDVIIGTVLWCSIAPNGDYTLLIEDQYGDLVQHRWSDLRMEPETS